jgi:thiamine-phosphate pyrophosphorylase
LRGLTVLADDDPRWKHDPVEQAAAACAGGAAAVQLRAKHATDTVALVWSAAIRALTRAHSALFFVNDRFDLALAADADGVHLGQEDIPPSSIPEELRQRLLIGRSTHTLEEARAAKSEPIDYVAFGPVFGTRSKASDHSARELPILADVVRLVDPLPVIAIGGIDPTNAADVAGTGAAGIAVISALAAASDPEGAARELADAMREAGSS